MAEFKQCPNGHYYQGATCPYCKTGSNTASSNTSAKTEIFGGGGGGNEAPTQLAGGDNTATVVAGGGGTAPTLGSGSTASTYVPSTGKSNAAQSNRTVFGDETDFGMDPSRPSEPKYRSTRKLVGWLVTYSLDPMGVDFKLYEGRNSVGRDMDCNITVNDNMISAKHAVILFRSGKYSITDQQSSHGTFVNDEDIDLEPRYLSDGDTIKMGKTVFKFRTSF